MTEVQHITNNIKQKQNNTVTNTFTLPWDPASVDLNHEVVWVTVVVMRVTSNGQDYCIYALFLIEVVKFTGFLVHPIGEGVKWVGLLHICSVAGRMNLSN